MEYVSYIVRLLSSHYIIDGKSILCRGLIYLYIPSIDDDIDD
ncbi:hypothetical protein [Swinepox virus]|uniref:Uncharacterized protein n=1 Tax=Swinepox virus TaxID=10276 RepID=A0A881SY97_SWPV|nr:hypothetical protein [Swinepox virus]